MMFENKLEGPLPMGIGYLEAVRELLLYNNHIDGTLPDTIGDARTLTTLRLDSNKLSGTIPSTIGQLDNVRELDMHDNAIGGTIPSEVSGLRSASLLYLDHNQLHGQIPCSIGELEQLEQVRLSHNQLGGVIPPTVGTLFALVRLQLDHNAIGGSIPSQLGQLSLRLSQLHLHSNQLNGLLPGFFKLPAFRNVDIDLSANPFWCPLPAWPAISTAACVHCANDTYPDDPHRTCSDHGVCIDGEYCRCDPEWEGVQCELLRCPNNCNGHGNCYNARTPEECSVNATSDPTAGMCQDPAGHCVAAYHDCPSKGISSQVDSDGIVIKSDQNHNFIVYARCFCLDAWSGAGCTEEPPPPPTEEPWPDPYDSYESSASHRSRILVTLLPLMTAALFVAHRPAHSLSHSL